VAALRSPKRDGAFLRRGVRRGTGDREIARDLVAASALHLACARADTHSKSKRRKEMNWDQIAGQWNQVKGQVKSKWAKVTDDDLASLSGKKDALVGKLQERYGIMKEEAEKQIDEWIAKLPPPPPRN
jgi:uncharacterized protein YjbJ (UPF0337 family)